MADIQSILLTSTLTVLSGVVLLVLGQGTIRFLLEPIQDLKQSILEAGTDLDSYANVYTSPGRREPDELETISD